MNLSSPCKCLAPHNLSLLLRLRNHLLLIFQVNARGHVETRKRLL